MGEPTDVKEEGTEKKEQKDTGGEGRKTHREDLAGVALERVHTDVGASCSY